MVDAAGAAAAAARADRARWSRRRPRRWPRSTAAPTTPAGIDRVCGAVAECSRGAGFTRRARAARRAAGALAATLALGRTARGCCSSATPTRSGRPGTAAGSGRSRRDGAMLSGPGVGDMKGCLVMAAQAMASAARRGGRSTASARGRAAGRPGRGARQRRQPRMDRAPRPRGAAACLGLEAGWPGGGRRRRARRGRRAARHRPTGAAPTRPRTRARARARSRRWRRSSPRSRRSADRAAAARCRGRRSIRGGVARQVVPDRAELEVDLRAPDDRAAAEPAGRARALVAARRRPRRRARTARAGSPGRRCPRWRRALAVGARARARAAELGVAAAAAFASRGGADASFAAALGVPTIDGLGPICHDSCARGERIEIASLAERGALMALMLVRSRRGCASAVASTRVSGDVGPGRASPGVEREGRRAAILAGLPQAACPPTAAARRAATPPTRGSSRTARRGPSGTSRPRVALAVEAALDQLAADLEHVLLVAEVQRERAHVAVQALERVVAEGGARAADVERLLGRVERDPLARGAAS